MLQVRGNDSLLLWGVTAVVITVVIGMWQHRRRRNSIPTKWREVGTLSDMQIYPLKSGTAMVLNEATCTQYGLQMVGGIHPALRDRCFLVYSEKNGEFKTARTFPNMVFIKLTPDGVGFVKLSAPKMPDIVVKIPDISEKSKIKQCTIWNDVRITALDCGDEIAAWLSKYILNLDSGLRLGHSIPEFMPIRTVADKHKGLKHLRNIDTGAYPDVSSYMLMAQSSIDDLQTRVPPHIKVSHRQFRPNFVVKGSQPYEEDRWQWIKIGETATFRAVKPCTRCLFTTIDPDTGIMESNREPLRTLREYRISDNPTMMKIGDKSPVLGMHYGIYKKGNVRVGDKIYVGETCNKSVY